MNFQVTESTIHLNVSAALKGRWVRASRMAGMKLSDWIIDAVEAHMRAHIKIPDNIDFSDLKLSRDKDGMVSFDWATIEEICDASGLDIGVFRDAPEDSVSGLIVAWYSAHRGAGGAQDPVAEDLIAEVVAEDSAGQGFSLPPGRA